MSTNIGDGNFSAKSTHPSTPPFDTFVVYGGVVVTYIPVREYLPKNVGQSGTINGSLVNPRVCERIQLMS